MLSIIIVTYNGNSYLSNCLCTIKSLITENREIIVVDNASTDRGPHIIRSEHPDVRLIMSKVNLGFAGGNNLGVSFARGRYLLLLNHDTELTTQIGEALTILERNESVGVIGARMIGKNGEYRFSAGYYPSLLRLMKINTLYKKSGYFRSGKFPPKSPQRFYYVDWVEGSFLLTRKNLWDRLGGMDEHYFMYGEDVDYCKRLHDAGFRTIYMPAIQYIHHGGYDAARLPLVLQGVRRFHNKYSGKTKRFLATCILKFGIIARSCYYRIRFFMNNKPEYRGIIEMLSRIKL